MGNRKKRPGRPRKPGCRQVSFWADDKRVAAYDKHAKRAGLSRSQWLGMVADRSAGVR